MSVCVCQLASFPTIASGGRIQVSKWESSVIGEALGYLRHPHRTRSYDWQTVEESCFPTSEAGDQGRCFKDSQMAINTCA